MDEDGEPESVHAPEQIAVGEGALGRAALERRAAARPRLGLERRTVGQNLDLRADGRRGQAGRA